MKKKIIFSFCLLLFLSIPLPLFAQLKTDQDPAGKHPYRYIAPVITPDDLLNVYPQSIPFWTGTTDSTNKTDGEVNTVYPNLGWMVFDVSGIPDGSIINSITFNGYVINLNWPYWSITPMGSVDPINSNAADIYNQVSNNWQQGVAYSYNDGPSIDPPGYLLRSLEPNALVDLQNALPQDWFAMGFIDWDFNPTWYINFAGWNSPNQPYLEIDYSPIPVEVVSFTAEVNENNVTLNWSTATETNNQGFEVQRSRSGGEYETVTFVNGKGTTTEMQYYSYIDAGLAEGIYNYRLKQVDYDGSFEYSEALLAEVVIPKVYLLSQNYPNPFNPNTRIDFNLASDSKVTLKVYDLLGQEVVTLLNSDLVAGIHYVNFDAASLNSGVYLYEIVAGDFISTKKMVLLK